MAYNLTYLENTTTLPELFSVLNDTTNGFLGITLLAITLFISFAVFKNYDTLDDLIISSFVSVAVGIVLYLLNAIAFIWLLTCIIMLVVTILVKIFIKDG